MPRNGRPAKQTLLFNPSQRASTVNPRLWVKLAFEIFSEVSIKIRKSTRGTSTIRFMKSARCVFPLRTRCSTLWQIRQCRFSISQCAYAFGWSTSSAVGASRTSSRSRTQSKSPKRGLNRSLKIATETSSGTLAVFTSSSKSKRRAIGRLWRGRRRSGGH